MTDPNPDSHSDDFLVKRTDLKTVRWAPCVTRANGPLAAGDALLKVDRYAFTANNITYALVGEFARYWDCFPAAAGWGRIPVWGFADVVASRAPDLPEGTRVFGYLPMSPLLKVQASDVTERGFVDASPHRAQLPAFYQSYARTLRGDPKEDDLRALLQPVSLTGWLLDDWLIENRLFGARQVLFGSASSKTALSAAFSLGRRADRTFEVIGLTSARHRAFCERTGYYDRVLDYEQVASLAAETPAVFVDMSGSSALYRAVHGHFKDALRHSCAVGLTHGKVREPLPLPGPVPQFFMAAAVAAKRRKELGQDVLEARSREAVAAFFASARGWLQLSLGRGAQAIESSYRRVLQGEVEPQEGVILAP